MPRSSFSASWRASKIEAVRPAKRAKAQERKQRFGLGIVVKICDSSCRLAVIASKGVQIVFQVRVAITIGIGATIGGIGRI